MQERLRPVVAERSPSDLRAAVARWENEGGLVDDEPIDLSGGAISIEPVLPFRLDLSVWALRRRPRNAVDRWDGTSYRRALALTDEPVGFSATRVGGLDVPYLAVALAGASMSRREEDDVRSSIERMLGLRVDLSTFYEMAEADSLISSLVARFRGLKPPRLPTVFESLLNAVACQQLSLEAGLSLLNRLAESHGQAVSIDGTTLDAFPRPSDLAGLEPQSLRRLGFSLRKATTIVELSRAVVVGRLDLEALDRLADDEILARLTSLPGIGRWSAEYVLLRGLGRLHVFPGDDVGARNNLARWLGLEPPLDYRAVGQAVSRWQPYAGMVYFHLLLRGLETRGELEWRTDG
ncbi:MAG: DNA-3-methyladenine glycosylase 2 [Actinomycetota bacterium]